MADTRNIRLVRAMINGFEIMAALEGFTPPSVEKTTDEDKGGRFISMKTVTGIEIGDWTLNLSGASPELIASMGEGENTEITVLESIKGDDGSEVPRSHEMSGEVLKSELGEIKPGKESLTLSGSPYAYTMKENRQIIHDINKKTQKCIVGKKDLLATARRHVGLA